MLRTRNSKLGHLKVRKSFDTVADRFGIKTQHDWYQISSNQLKPHASTLLHDSKFNTDSIATALQSAYPEFQWNKMLFSFTPKVRWNKKHNQKYMFDWISEQLGVNTQEDWYTVNTNDIHAFGGKNLLNGNSLYSSLQSVYPQFEWNMYKFLFSSDRIWKNKNNHRPLFDWFASELGISKQDDWYAISRDQFHHTKLESVINNYYNGSLYDAVEQIYPEFSWNPLLFNRNLNSKHKFSQRKSLDWLAEQLGVELQEEWYGVSVDMISDLGTNVMKNLTQHLDMSWFSAFQSIYPEFSWNPFRFHKSLRDAKWKDHNTQRQILDWIGNQLGIEAQEDWLRVGASAIQSICGEDFLQLHNNSIIHALRVLYPEFEWQPETKSNVQLTHEAQRRHFDMIAEKLSINTFHDWYEVTYRQLRKLGIDSIVSNTFNGSLLSALQSVYNEFEWNPLSYRSYRLHRGNRKKLFDKIAVECKIHTQSEWYSFIEDKMDSLGVSPSWIINTLRKIYPQYVWKHLPDDSVPKLLLAHSWNEDIDPTGYWMSEKFDGSRALWDGSRFVSRRGQVWKVPEWFTVGLPRDIRLDGELWAGRNSYDKLYSLVKRKEAPEDEWKTVMFKVFDVPTLSQKSFEERMKFIEDYFASNDVPCAEPVKHEKCNGVDHLITTLRRIESEAGEGVMLRLPGSPYVPKRSKSLLKVKSFYDAEARVIAHKQKHFHFKKTIGLVCEMEDGRQLVVGRGLSEEDRINPPPVGSVITFKYVPSSSGIPKFASYKGIRSDAQFCPKYNR